MSKPIALEEAAGILPNLTRCPRHPQYVVLPFYGLYPCCLYEALEQIRDDNPHGSEARVAERAIAPPQGVLGMPRLWRR